VRLVTGSGPAGLPPRLAALLAAQNARFLTEVDRLDPAALAAKPPASTPVLVFCSDADIQVSCADVDHLVSGLAHADLDRVTLHGVNHVGKEDSSRTAAHYGDPLPFSTQLETAIGEFADRHLAR